MRAIIDCLAIARALPGVRVGVTESDLNGESCSLYFLGTPLVRVAVNLNTFRGAVVKSVEQACGYFVKDSRLPIFRPVPVIALKSCFSDDSRCTYLMRCVLDLDFDDKQRTPLDCDVRTLVDLVVAFLSRHTRGFVDWASTPVFAFEGKFADKPRSLHVYFPELAFASGSANAMKLVDFGPLNVSLHPYGLKCDPAPASSGLKLPFSDKSVKGVYRNDVQRLVFAFRGAEPVDLSSILWEELFAWCFPAVLPGDHVVAQLTWVIAAPAVAVEPVQKRHRMMATSVAGATPEERLALVVPSWLGVPYKTTRTGALRIFVPNSSFCPLKDADSSDAPANYHASNGKAYAVLGVLGALTIRCQICSGRELVVPPSGDSLTDEEREILARFAGFVKVGHDQVLMLGGDMPLIKRQAFISTYKRANERVALGSNRFQSYPDFWYEHWSTPFFPRGVALNPDPDFDDHEVYNTYEGHVQAIVQASFAQESRFALLMTPRLDVVWPRLFSLVPAWTKMVFHNICGGQMESFLYFHNWMAYAVQFPHKKPRVALVLVGSPGCGKNRAIEPLKFIYGKHALTCTDLNTPYTSIFYGAIITHYDEADGETSHKNGAAAHAFLKSLITEEGTTMTRQIYEAPRSSRNFCHVIVTANSRGAVYWQQGERRFAGFDCQHRVCPANTPDSVAFFAQVAREVDTQVCVLYHFWKNLDVSDFEPGVTPFNRGTFLIQYNSMSTEEKYLYQVLLTTHVTPSDLDHLSTEDEARINGLLTETRRVRPLLPDRTAATAGFGVFTGARADEAHFKGLWSLGYAQMFPGKHNSEVPLWRFLSDFNKNSQSGPLFESKQVRVAGDKRVYAIMLKQPLAAWRTEFEASRNLSPRIWEEDAIRL